MVYMCPFKHSTQSQVALSEAKTIFQKLEIEKFLKDLLEDMNH